MKNKKIFWLPILIVVSAVSLFSAYKWYKKPKFPQLIGAHEVLDDLLN